MKFLAQVWNEIRRGENIDLYVAVPLAFGLAMLSLLNIDFAVQLLTPITLVILSLLATSLLGTRHLLKELTEKVTSKSDIVLIKDLPAQFETDFERATDFWLVGVSLTTIIRLHYSLMERKLRAGHTIKALLVHPEGPAIEMAEIRAYGRTNVERARSEVQNSIQDLQELKQITGGKLEIRTIQNPLSHGIVAFNPESPSGVIYIQNYPFKTEGGSRPKLILYPKDGYWYELYKTEFYNLWNHGVEWQNKEQEPGS